MKVINRAMKLIGKSLTKNDVAIRVLEVDKDGNISRCSGLTAPTGAGYAKGCLFVKTDAASGVSSIYENVGTTSTASFNLIGDIAPGEITLAEGNILLGNASGVGAALDAGTDAQMLIGDGDTLVSVAISGAISIINDGTVSIADDAVSLEHLDDGILPSHVVKYAGEFTTVGGDTDETISVAGVVATDLVVVTLHTAGATPVTVIDAAAGTDQIDVDMSADPSNDHVLTYVVYRAAA